jgi:hypothetical protein
MEWSSEVGGWRLDLFWVCLRVRFELHPFNFHLCADCVGSLACVCVCVCVCVWMCHWNCFDSGRILCISSLSVHNLPHWWTWVVDTAIFAAIASIDFSWKVVERMWEEFVVSFYNFVSQLDRTTALWSRSVLKRWSFAWIEPMVHHQQNKLSIRSNNWIARPRLNWISWKIVFSDVIYARDHPKRKRKNARKTNSRRKARQTRKERAKWRRRTNKHWFISRPFCDTATDLRFQLQLKTHQHAHAHTRVNRQQRNIHKSHKIYINCCKRSRNESVVALLQLINRWSILRLRSRRRVLLLLRQQSRMHSLPSSTTTIPS